MSLGIIMEQNRPRGQVITEEGEFEVTIDSLKEAQGLYLLEVVGYKADILNCYGKFPLEKIRS